MVGRIIKGNKLKLYHSPTKGDKYTVVPSDKYTAVPSDNNHHNLGTR